MEYDDQQRCFILKDLNSSGGTFVQDCRVQNAAVRLSEGDIIRFGFNGLPLQLRIEQTKEVFFLLLPMIVSFSFRLFSQQCHRFILDHQHQIHYNLFLKQFHQDVVQVEQSMVNHNKLMFDKILNINIGQLKTEQKRNVQIFSSIRNRPSSAGAKKIMTTTNGSVVRCKISLRFFDLRKSKWNRFVCLLRYFLQPMRGQSAVQIVERSMEVSVLISIFHQLRQPIYRIALIN